MLRIVMNRIIWSLTKLIHGQAPESLDLEHQTLCRMIWMCLPWTREVSLMAAILFGDPLYLSYEGANGDVKEYLLTYLLEIAKFRGRLPKDRGVVDKYLIQSALAVSGRGEFHERSDFPYWESRSSSLVNQNV